MEMEDTEKLDTYLWNTISFLKNSKNPYKGVVGACLTDGKELSAYSTSEKFPDGRSVHAERNAVREFVSKYDIPSQEVILITSLSPCSEPSQFREGDPCISLLLGTDREFKNLPIVKTYIGKIDPTQKEGRLYEHAVTKNKILIEKCDQLFQYFDPSTYGTPPQKFVEETLYDFK